MGGTTLARYSYDAWGKCTITEDTTEVDIATVNPYRYRSYYYDSETQLYYLQSRYYDPETGRFLNADEAEIISADNTVISCNLFTYCKNDPVNNSDIGGKIPTFVFVAIGAVFGFFVQYLIDVISNIIDNKKNWSYVSASLNGALAATGIGKMAAMFSSAIISTVDYIVTTASSKKVVNKSGAIFAFIIGLICGKISGSGANLKKVSGIVKTSKVIKRTSISSKKILMYTNKITSQIKNVVKSVKNYIFSAITSVVSAEAKKYLKEIF